MCIQYVLIRNFDWLTEDASQKHADSNGKIHKV